MFFFTKKKSLSQWSWRPERKKNLPSQTLRSSGASLSTITQVSSTTHGEVAFRYYSRRLWNSLLENLRAADTVGVLKVGQDPFNQLLLNSLLSFFYNPILCCVFVSLILKQMHLSLFLEQCVRLGDWRTHTLVLGILSDSSDKMPNIPPSLRSQTVVSLSVVVPPKRSEGRNLHFVYIHPQSQSTLKKH